MSGHSTASSTTRFTARVAVAAASLGLAVAVFGSPAYADTTVSATSQDLDPPGEQDTHTVYLTARTPVCTDSAARTWSVQWVAAHSGDEAATVSGGLSGSMAGSSTATVTATQNYTGAMASVTMSITVNWTADAYVNPPAGYTGYPPVSPAKQPDGETEEVGRDQAGDLARNGEGARVGRRTVDRIWGVVEVLIVDYSL